MLVVGIIEQISNQSNSNNETSLFAQNKHQSISMHVITDIRCSVHCSVRDENDNNNNDNDNAGNRSILVFELYQRREEYR